MTVHDSVLDLVGATPLVRLRRVTEGIAASVLVKLEQQNPGASVKDRAALAMVRAAERSGALQPGGTIVEGTSGNTGVGLAQVAAVLGYRIIVVVPDRTAAEKLDVLRAYGAEVIPTPSSVPREDDRHVIRRAELLAAATPGGWLADQYGNPANPAVHEYTTGPEIWADTRGAVSHFVAGIGTGGTISGTGRYLKDVSGGRVRIIGADPASSVYGGGDGSPFLVEASGHYRHPDTVEDTWPSVYDVTVPDRIERVPDRESIRMVWRLAREEGLLVGGSAGLAVAAALRVARDLGAEHTVVALLPDSGRNYVSKYHSPQWCRRLGFLDDDRPDLLAGSGLLRPVHAVTTGATVCEALALAEGAAADQPAVPVVLAGRDPVLPAASGDVLGELTAAELHAAGERAGWDEPVDVTGDRPVPLTVGTGETAAEALARLDAAGAGHAWLLRDGRLAGVVTAGQLRDLALGRTSAQAAR